MPLRIVRRPKSPYWVVRGTVRGVRVEESTGTSDRRVAEEIRTTREAEILTESVFGRRAVVTFAGAALSYLESDGERRFMVPILKHFGTTALGRIDQDSIDKAARKILPNASDATRNRQVYTPIAAVMHHAAKRKLCAALILERPHIDKVEVRWLSIEEAERLIEAAADHLRPLLIFLFYTGARCGEALWLDWRNVDLSRGHVSFPKTKNDDARGVPLHPRVVAALANLPHRDGEVFRKPNGEPYTRPRRDDDKSAGARIKKGFSAACRRAGIEDFTPHGCRHTWATWHYAANRDLGALMRLGGWKSERMVMRYAHVNVAELRHTILALPGGNLGDTIMSKGKFA
jgi:integrase